MSGEVTATGYLVIEGCPSVNGSILSAKIDRAAQRGHGLETAKVAVKISTALPTSVFDAAVAEVAITVPEELVSAPDVQVRVG